ADAVVRLVLEPLIGIPTASAHAAAAGVVVLRKARGALPERGWQPLLPQIRRLGHVRVARDARLAAYGSESLLGHVDITESWERHGVLPSMALFRPLQNARDNTGPQPALGCIPW